LQRNPEAINHGTIRDFPRFLQPGDVIVLNNSKVFPARLRGRNKESGGAFEILLIEENARNDWWVMLRPGRRGSLGTEIILHDTTPRPTSLSARVVEINAEGHRRMVFSAAENIADIAEKIGEAPLPPYIHRKNGSEADDRERYQTVFANARGSVAAPTAGLHFTQELLSNIRRRGVEIAFVTLHVGLGTFAPVKSDLVSEHQMHEERYVVSDATAAAVSAARERGSRIVAVGTTSLRVLESVAAANDGKLAGGSGRTRIFIHPPYRFQIANALLTNFHLPRSTLLMLVSAFAAPGETRGRDLVLRAYTEAIKERYRFFSFGDAMFIQ